MDKEQIRNIIAIPISFILNELLGGWDLAMQTFLIFVIVDRVSGYAKGTIEGNLNSQKGHKGFAKIILQLCGILVAHRLDLIFESNGATRQFVIYYLMSIQGLSIVENIGTVVEMPDYIVSKLEQLQNKGKKDED